MTSLTTRPILFAAAFALLGSSITSHAQTTFAWVSTNTNNNSLVTAGNYSPSSGVNSDGNANGVFVFGRSNTTTTNLVNTSSDFKLLTLQFESAAQKGFVLTNSKKFLFEGSTRSIIQGSSFSNNVRGGIKVANGALTLGGDGTGIMVLSSGATSDDFGGNGLLKTGSSSFFLDKAFGNTVTISNGTLAYRTNNAIGQIQLRGGVLATTGTFSRALGTGTANVNFGAGGGGFAAYGGALTVSTALSNWGSTADSLSNGTALILGSRIADNVVTLSSALNLGGAAGTNRVITLVDNTNSAADAAVISGAISGAANLVLGGAGTLSLSASNSYSNTVISNGVALKIGTNGTTGTLGTGNVTNNGALIFHRSNDLTASNVISGTGALSKLGAGTVTLSGANTYSGTTTIGAGALKVGDNGTTGTLGAGNVTNNGTLIFHRSDNLTASNAISGTGALSKLGAGTVTLSAANTFSGATTVSAGTLNLNNVAGGSLGSTTNVSVATNAVLLVSQSNQVNNASAVSLSGGTIRTPAGISETFGNLSVTGSGTLDFGATFGNASSMNFGTYTPSALLTLNNFNFGSTLTFKTDLTSSITNSSFFTFNNGGISSFNWNAGTSTFTITAIPEPSTVLAVAGLVGLMLWPSRRRLLKDARSILGLRRPMRDRLAARQA